MIGSNLDLVIDSLDEPILLLDKERVVSRSNRAAELVLGEDLVGQSVIRVLRHPDVIRCIDVALESNETAKAEIRLLSPHQTTYRVTALPLLGDTPVGIVLKDVSPLIEAAQMRSDFVANVSHELRSPLTTLSGLIETLQGSAKDDAGAQERFLSIMAREAERMDRLIADLLSLSRVEENEKVRPTEPIDLRQLIRSVITNICERDGTDQHNIVFDGKGDARVPGDSDQLIQVFQNLLENAVKYSRSDGTITVVLEREEQAPGFAGPVWRARIADEGEGIAPEHIPRLTERFYRVDSGRSREKGGTGLGLAIVKHIVSRHRGRLSIKSEMGTGTEISVTLPALKKD